ncbi:hypothetical protein DICSQDRAFT_175605 [Dichomitus squalens LYAD-421 SS1]|uniref:DUF6532 domain-containing protein n=1 Tax=Dichomitus squalens (strain LYAD-421) TaxID=732165 RepID=R7SHV5_DICSQ|nr:uncharacterized protein DICSQDRAFT_175605 [Dichomitus squalens LYAD-421 SS1]EJF55704.1 hypothetical protein DICSQDRAFT_175605 [Dichomitus squalens LYAD-421 SS1]
MKQKKSQHVEDQAGDSADAEDDGVDGLPPESEDGSSDKDAIASLQASLMRRQTTAVTPGPAARIRRCEGHQQDSLAPDVVSTPSTSEQRTLMVPQAAVSPNSVPSTPATPAPANAPQSICNSDDSSETFDVATGHKEKYSEHALIGRSLEIAFFSNTRTGVGFLHSEFFDPIPDQALAFVHTFIHAHICEWFTGRHIREDFSEVKNATFYAGFLADLQSYGSKNPSAWLNIRKRMYSSAFTASGGATLRAQITRVSTFAMEAATAELEGRTGLTDSETEGEARAGGL